MYKVNIPWNELRDSLVRLQEAEALAQVVRKKVILYEITEIGNKILSSYAGIQSCLNRTETEAPRNFDGFIHHNR